MLQRRDARSAGGCTGTRTGTRTGIGTGIGMQTAKLQESARLVPASASFSGRESWLVCGQKADISWCVAGAHRGMRTTAKEEREARKQRIATNIARRERE